MAVSYRVPLAMVTLAAFLAYAAATVFFYLGKYKDKSPLKYFNYSIPYDGYENHKLDITPAWWTWWIWAGVFGWQLPWLLYSFVIPCRRNAPKVMNIAFMLIVFFAFGFTLGWVFLWEEELINASLGFMLGVCLCTYICLAIAYYRLDELLVRTKSFSCCDHFMIEMFVTNGLGLYAAWATFSTFLHCGIVLKHTANVEDHITGTIILAGLAGTMSFWFLLDVFVFLRFTRYTFTFYPAFVVGFTGIFQAKWDDTDRNSIINVTLLGVAGLMGLIKILLLIWWSCRQKRRVKSMVVTDPNYPNERYDMDAY